MSFWFFIFSKKGYTYRKKQKLFITPLHPKRAVLSASMTLEATLIIPMFIVALVVFINMLNLLNRENRYNERLYNSARTMSKLAYLNDESKETEEDTTLNNLYTFKGAGAILNIRPILCMQKVTVRNWIGDKDDKVCDGYGYSENDRLVYVTYSGTVYHKDRSCSHINVTPYIVDGSRVDKATNLNGEKYSACQLCFSNTKSYYVTDYGNKYHSDRNCSGIKRYVMTIPLSKAAAYGVCSKCGG